MKVPPSTYGVLRVVVEGRSAFYKIMAFDSFGEQRICWLLGT